jgi:hypothetical protein
VAGLETRMPVREADGGENQVAGQAVGAGERGMNQQTSGPVETGGKSIT